MKPAAEIKNLRVAVDGRTLVDGVDLRVLPGRVTALVGPSGSGKTTTGLALLGEYPAGAHVTGDVRAPRGRVGYIPQHPGSVLNPARRIGALLRDIARTRSRHLPRRERAAFVGERVRWALSLARLPDATAMLRRFPHQLSGGQQQRVVLAQALLLGADVVVADEPTTGQDALTRRSIVDRLAAVAREGIAVVLLSHDLDVVRALADDILVLHDGRVVESAPAERLWRAARHPRAAALLASASAPAPLAPQAVGETVLRVGPLTARHGRTTVLRTPALGLRTGECLAVVGRSGSGKTTLARCLAGLHRHHDGRITLDGTPLPRSLRDRTRQQLASVQYVFQDAKASFDEHRPVLDQVARTAVRLHGASEADALTEALGTLTRLGLTEDLARRRPDRLSGGELQRAALARGLLARPRVLICDEITSGLDTLSRQAVLDTLAGLVHDRGDLALMLITHDLTTAALATRIAVLEAGEVVEEGPAHQVLTAPQHPFSVRLMEARRGSHGGAPLRSRG
ncbi:ABC transporter ATP-binding protein [Streptomyces sp. NPDC048330]|uniref:ABC transporter ATP-binding protein n=1 Tax=Streptomyces sp. NPDC048330 TaxID=3365533 RepID=UPI00371F2F28